LINFTLNTRPVSTPSAPDKPLLWALREELNLTGTKFACGIAKINGQRLRNLPFEAIS
jgi:isoquinoline 1-oxidoreductase alpha subunit